MNLSRKVILAFATLSLSKAHSVYTFNEASTILWLFNTLEKKTTKQFKKENEFITEVKYALTPNSIFALNLYSNFSQIFGPLTHQFVYTSPTIPGQNHMPPRKMFASPTLKKKCFEHDGMRSLIDPKHYCKTYQIPLSSLFSSPLPVIQKEISKGGETIVVNREIFPEDTSPAEAKQFMGYALQNLKLGLTKQFPVLSTKKTLVGIHSFIYNQLPESFFNRFRDGYYGVKDLQEDTNLLMGDIHLTKSALEKLEDPRDRAWLIKRLLVAIQNNPMLRTNDKIQEFISDSPYMVQLSSQVLQEFQSLQKTSVLNEKQSVHGRSVITAIRAILPNEAFVPIHIFQAAQGIEGHPLTQAIQAIVAMLPPGAMGAITQIHQMQQFIEPDTASNNQIINPIRKLQTNLTPQVIQALQGVLTPAAFQNLQEIKAALPDEEFQAPLSDNEKQVVTSFEEFQLLQEIKAPQQRQTVQALEAIRRLHTLQGNQDPLIESPSYLSLYNEYIVPETFVPNEATKAIINDKADAILGLLEKVIVTEIDSPNSGYGPNPSVEITKRSEGVRFYKGGALSLIMDYDHVQYIKDTETDKRVLNGQIGKLIQGYSSAQVDLLEKNVTSLKKMLNYHDEAKNYKKDPRDNFLILRTFLQQLNYGVEHRTSYAFALRDRNAILKIADPEKYPGEEFILNTSLPPLFEGLEYTFNCAELSPDLHYLLYGEKSPHQDRFSSVKDQDRVANLTKDLERIAHRCINEGIEKKIFPGPSEDFEKRISQHLDNGRLCNLMGIMTEHEKDVERVKTKTILSKSVKNHPYAEFEGMKTDIEKGNSKFK
jgi:hypothetical protein